MSTIQGEPYREHEHRGEGGRQQVIKALLLLLSLPLFAILSFLMQASQH